MAALQFFKPERISEHITCITGITGELMFLVEGSDRAALIDTGIGLGDLGALVKSLTSKPLLVILTHGHLDHAGNVAPFDRVYMNPADHSIFFAHQDKTLQAGYVKMMLGDKASLIQDSDYARPGQGGFLPLQPGDVFPLGGITLEIHEGAGHTPGSVTILLPEERTLLLGDACNYCTFLWDQNSSSVEDYRAMLRRLLDNLAGRYDRTLVSHGSPVAPREMIESNIGICDDIMAGRSDEVPFAFMGEDNGHVFVARAMSFEGGAPHRTDGGIGNIVYNKLKIWNH